MHWDHHKSWTDRVTRIGYGVGKPEFDLRLITMLDSVNFPTPQLPEIAPRRPKTEKQTMLLPYSVQKRLGLELAMGDGNARLLHLVPVRSV